MKKEFKINIVKNKSKTYLLPFIHQQVNFKFHELMINTYLSFEDGDELFCVMYIWDSSPDFLKFEGEMMNNHLYVGHSDFGNRVVFKFRLSRHMKIGRTAFIEGRYTEFSDDHKESIMSYLSLIGATNNHRIMEILNPNGALSSTPPNMEQEIVMNHVKELTFKIDDFNENN